MEREKNKSEAEKKDWREKEEGEKKDKDAAGKGTKGRRGGRKYYTSFPFPPTLPFPLPTLVKLLTSH